MFIPPVCRCTLLKEIFHYTCTVGGYVIPVWHPRLSLKGIKKWMTWLDSYYGSRQSNKGGMGVCVGGGGGGGIAHACLYSSSESPHTLSSFFLSLFFFLQIVEFLMEQNIKTFTTFSEIFVTDLSQHGAYVLGMWGLFWKNAGLT